MSRFPTWLLVLLFFVNAPALFAAIHQGAAWGAEVTAAEAQKNAGIDFSQTLLDLKGQPFKDPQDATGKTDLTLGMACAEALSAAPAQGEPPLSLKDSFKRGDLARAIAGGGVKPLPAGDVSTIEGAITRVWAPLVAQQIIVKIDPNYDPNK